MPNATMLKFGFPETVLAEYEHWCVLLRPQQVTAGCMVLACKSDAGCLPDVEPAAFAELASITSDLEEALRSTFGFDKINYLLLMMVDKHVHWHVIPRYAQPRSFANVEFVDHGWPRLPDMTRATDVPVDSFAALRHAIQRHWPHGG